MGTSNWQNIPYNINLIRKIDPQTILDLGVGFGRWGILFREFLEVWDSGIYDGKWKKRIDGVEIYSGYIQQYHKYFYDNIYINSALDYLKTTKMNYDLIYFGDVLEHMVKVEGENSLELAMEKGKYVLITVPIGKYWEQDGTPENQYEAHRSVWYNKDFVKYKHNRIKSFQDFTRRDFSVVLLSSKRIRLGKRFGRYFELKNFFKHKLGLKKLIERYERTKTEQ